MPSNPRLFKCLSLWQIWASLMAIDAKKNETRGWYMGYRGPLAIHAAKCKDSLPMFTKSPFRECFEKAGIMSAADLPLGCVLCVGDVIDCQPTHELVNTISSQEKAFGNYAPGRWGIITANLRVFTKPIPAVGKQGLFAWTMPEDAELVPVEVQP